MNESIPKNPIRFGIFLSKQHKVWVISALLAMFIATALERFTVVVLRNLTDSITNHADMQTVWMWALGFPLVYFLAQALWRVSGFTGMRWFIGMQSLAYTVLYEYLSLHSKDYFNNRFAGSLANKISNAADGTNQILENSLWRFFPLLIGIVWYTTFVSVSDMRLGVIIIMWSVLYLGLNVLFAKKLQPHSYHFAESQSTLKGRLVDSLSNISLVHEYAYIAGEQEYIKSFIKKRRDKDLALWWFSEWILVINETLIFLFMLSMIGFSVYLFAHQLISVGAIVMVIAIVVDLSNQLFSIGQEMREVAKHYGEAKEGLEEILREHLIINAPDATEIKFSDGTIAVEEIDFDYGKTKVFKDFSLFIPAGQKIGFVGRSGAGKTTFVSLLLRHFDVQDGAIKIDGQDIRDVTLESLRQAIAFVPQDTSLFHRTIRENIRYSNPHATNSQVEEAAKQAQADGFIKKLQDGYDTLVGERGVKLSGGQRQRIAIARAFLKNAPILILDEATSSLDSESESLIQESLVHLMKGRTVIAIAHRLSTLKEMDRLVLIHGGKIVEDGTPEELLKKKDGKFKNMWEHQVKGFVMDD